MARPKLSDSQTVRVDMVMPDTLVEKIDAWRKDRGINSRSDAIRQFCERGMQQDARILNKHAEGMARMDSMAGNS